MHKIVLSIILTSLVGCAVLPPFPEVNQCGYSVKFNKFRCKNNVTKKAFNVQRNDPMMEGAQCLPVADPQRSYPSAQAWVQNAKQIAEQRCR